MFRTSRPPAQAFHSVDFKQRHHHKHPSREAGSCFVKSFGRHLAFESLRSTNLRSRGNGLWGFRNLGELCSASAVDFDLQNIGL